MGLVAKSGPDGHTLLLGTTTLATNAAPGVKRPYGSPKDCETAKDAEVKRKFAGLGFFTTGSTPKPTWTSSDSRPSAGPGS